MRNYKKCTSFILTFVLAMSSFTFPVHAEDENNAGKFNVTGDSSGWEYIKSENTLIFKPSDIENAAYTVTGNGDPTDERIIVENNFEGKITIKDINISVSDAAFEVANTANLILELDGVNTLTSTGVDTAALQFSNANNTLENTHQLTIQDTDKNGTLNAMTSYNGAGIGGRDYENGNNITITGGTINATSGFGAGIGGGAFGSGNNITINGGTVTAMSGSSGAGIGGGSGSSGSGGFGNNITINGKQRVLHMEQELAEVLLTLEVK